MIKLERTSVMNFENAVRGMRNPMKSWDKSDSYTTHIVNPQTLNTADFQFVMGENDLKLAWQLAHAGSDHRKFPAADLCIRGYYGSAVLVEGNGSVPYFRGYKFRKHNAQTDGKTV